jgi:hypothetical protein
MPTRRPRRSWRPRLSDHQRTIARRAGALGGLTLLLVGGIWAILALAPRPTPDYLDADMDDILDYTLLSDDFNSLPIERRMELLRDLVQRLKTLSGEDSAAMAAFAATIKKEMRRQMERNIKQLAADTMDIYASDYAKTPPEEQDRFLDEAIIGFTEMMEEIAGEDSPLPRDRGERLTAIKDQARKDVGMLRENDERPTARRVAQFFEFIHSDQQNISDPVQRGRNVRFMRDMTRHLRGQDVATGKPRGPG